MTETVKKTTTRKPKTETAAKPSKAPARSKAKTNNLTVMQPSKEQIAALAHRYWAERGYQHGQDADDWFRAEQELRAKAS
jgi:hypothetical protein